jgi:phosphatidylserine decarboxylase
MNNLPIAKESFLYIIILALIAVISYFLYYPVAIFVLLILAFVIFFFRNPVRKIPEGKNIIVSPADGTVMSVTEIEESDFIKGKAIKVSIFLSLFNVHINRSPIEGTVQYTAYRPGKYLPAFKSHASDINERNTIGIENRYGVKIIVHQITGFVARRIVCWVKKGDKLQAGERFGLIKFGSCTEIIMPVTTKISVKPGRVFPIHACPRKVCGGIGGSRGANVISFYICNDN